VFLICGLLLLSFSACRWLGIKGNGEIKSEERPVTDFSELHADGSFDIEWRSGTPSLVITTDENLLPYVEVEMHGNYLRLHMRERVLPTHGLKVAVSSSQRTGAKLTGACDLVAHDLSGESYAVQTTGAAEMKLDGTVGQLLADMTGASELMAGKLQTKTAEVSMTGAASAEVSVSDNLNVTITGAGEVTYHGNPALRKHVTGAGEIRRKD
jgi:cysteine sulfinate desulfinase/cysteine desulfurase-like protein